MSDFRWTQLRLTRVQTWLVGVVAVVLAVAALRAVALAALPLVLAFFVTILFYPLQRWLERRLPRRIRWMGLLATWFGVVLVLAAAVVVFIICVNVIAQHSGRYGEKFAGLWEQFSRYAAGRGVPVQDVVSSSSLRDDLLGLLKAGVTYAWTIVALAIVVLFLVLLMLAEARHWRDKVYRLFSESRDTTDHMMDAIAMRIRRNLLVMLFISGADALGNGLWLWAMGADFPFVWAALIFLLEFIPNIGSVIVVTLPSLAMLVQRGVGHVLLTAGGLTVVETVVGYYFVPKLVSKALSMSPVVSLVAILFWGWVWGIPGAFLGLPITLTIIAICSQVPSLYPVALLLSHEAEGPPDAKPPPDLPPAPAAPEEE